MLATYTVCESVYFTDRHLGKWRLLCGFIDQYAVYYKILLLGEKNAMIGRLNHVAIAVPDLQAGIDLYANALGATVSAPLDQPEHGVTVVFVTLPNTKIELLYPLGEKSPIANFLEKNPSGGIHHICYEVTDLQAAVAKLMAEGKRVLGDGTPKIGAHGHPVVFLHPKDFNGTLIELEEVP
jgi:methylmalonyl-CoA/ethylmalonyl-CoA epimerase